MAERLPDNVRILLWDVAADAMDAERDSTKIFERVMTRGDFESMRWLLSTYDHARLRAFVVDRGERCLPPRELAFWCNVLDLELDTAATRPNGGRPVWAD